MIHASVISLDVLLKYLDNDLPTQILCLDLSSAFNSIKLDLLIYRLKLIGLENTVLLITSLTEHTVLKVTNHYHDSAHKRKVILKYLKDRPSPLYSSVFTYYP